MSKMTKKNYIKLDIWQLIKNYELKKKDNALLHTTSKQKMKKN